ncbi:MAG: arylsulfatase A-like enzyme [Halioglobus sp.]|jgi:arylsulfatase A-like enzyme
MILACNVIYKGALLPSHRSDRSIARISHLKKILAPMLMLLLTACYHPLEIIGEGDIVSTDIEHQCSLEEQPCANLVTGDYNVTYTALPRPGWHFVGWQRCGSQHPTCSFSTAANIVSEFSGQTFPALRAVFEEDTPPQSNILLIISDDQSFDHYGFAGHPVLQTPSIDALAAQSVQYPQAYVSSTCRPTLATMLTGLPEQRHGVSYISGPQMGSFSTIADRLGNAGYSSYQAGKFWEGAPDNRGFTDYMPFSTGSFTGNHEIGRTSIQPLFDFIDQTTSPWFVWFSPYMPHSPHNAPANYVTLYQGLGLDSATIEYFAMISWFDDVVGELLAGVPEDTIVIFLADNGYVQSGFGGVPVANSKNSSYEGGIRTQLLIRHPAQPVITRWELATTEDVSATILSIAGAYRDDLPGRDLLGPVPIESMAAGSRSSLGISTPWGQLLERWVRIDDWKLVDSVLDADRLYNLALDPGETQNEFSSPASFTELSNLQVELEAWWVE